MKNSSFIITVGILAFSLGIFSVWSIGGFSCWASLFEHQTVISEVSAQTNEVSSKLTPNKNKSVDLEKLTYPFEDCLVNEIYKGKNAPFKLTRQERRDYGEQYKLIENNEPDFAGHYIVATWSCGMWCQYSDIIDAKTGKFYGWNGILSYCYPWLDKDFPCNENFSSVENRIDSKLIVFFGYKNGEAGSRGFHYYKFENGRFIHLKSVLVKEQRDQSEILLDEGGRKTSPE